LTAKTNLAFYAAKSFLLFSLSIKPDHQLSMCVDYTKEMQQTSFQFMITAAAVCAQPRVFSFNSPPRMVHFGLL